MRIAYIGIKGLPAKGGADRVVEAIVHRLSPQNELTVYCSRDETPAGTQLDGIRLIRVPILRGKHLRSTSLFLLSALHALFVGRYDFIHLHNVEACFVLPLLKIRFPVIATSHGSRGIGLRHKWSRWAQALMSLTEYPFMHADVRTSVALIDAQYLVARHNKPVRYIPNGVDRNPPVDEAKAFDCICRHGLTKGNYILFAAGRIDPTKGCHLLLEAFRQVKGDCSLAIVGSSQQLPAYDRRLREMASRRVHFLPLISDKDVLFGVIRGCRFFVFPSTVEAMSMMLLEVGSLGVPIVCSDIPANSFMSGHAVLFKSADTLSLTQKMQWAVDNPDLLANIAKEAQSWIRNNYLWDRIVQMYEAAYAVIKPPRMHDAALTKSATYFQ